MREDLLGETNEAYADYTRSIKANGFMIAAFNSRALLSYDRNDFASALDDFNQVTALIPKEEPSGGSRDYNEMRIWLCNAHLGRKDAGTRDLKGYLETRPAAENFDWQLRLERYLAGAITEDALIAATKDAEAHTTESRRCEAYFYIGSVHLIAGDQLAAERDFRLCLATPVKTFTEYRSAKAEMDSLLKDGG